VEPKHMSLQKVSVRPYDGRRGKFTRTSFSFDKKRPRGNLLIMEGMLVLGEFLHALWGKIEVIREVNEEGRRSVHLIFSNHTRKAFGTLGDPDDLGIRYQMQD
jgi:hypothetical protein